MQKVTNARKKVIDNTKKPTYKSRYRISGNNDLNHNDTQIVSNNKLIQQLDNLTKRLSETEYELKEARYKINQFETNEQKLKDEKLLIQTQYNDMIITSKTKLKQHIKDFDDYNGLVRSEYERVVNGINTMYRSFFLIDSNRDNHDTVSMTSRVNQKLFDRIMDDVNKLQELLLSNPTTNKGSDKVDSSVHSNSSFSRDLLESSSKHAKDNMNLNHIRRNIPVSASVAVMFMDCQ